jgi:hypothetical protein
MSCVPELSHLARLCSTTHESRSQDKLSSPHIYIRMPEGMEWEKIPEKLLIDAGQLVKAGSIQVSPLPAACWSWRP